MTSAIDEFEVTNDSRPAARWPLAALADPGGIRKLPGRTGLEVSSGSAVIRRALVARYTSDRSKRGGALAPDGRDQIVRAIELAGTERRPAVGIWHSGGAALYAGRAALRGIGRVFHAIVMTSGSVPQVSVILGPVAAGCGVWSSAAEHPVVRWGYGLRAVR